MTRARLFGRLEYRRPLTLVVAPAGYGKTTLVVDWLGHAGSPFAWLSLDAYDDNLTGFMLYALAAIGTIFPNACPQTRALLDGSTLPPPSSLAHSLVNELEALPKPFILILDGYHSIQDLAVHQVMAELLHYQPNTLELIVIARHDPPLPLPALRARNRLTEIRAEDLRFSHEESRAFLQLENSLSVAEEQVVAVDAMTEGWAAGLRMTALLMQQGDMAEVSAHVEGTGRFAMEYLSNEVVAQLEPEIQEFLLKTSFLEQVCAPLCAAVLDGEATAAQCRTYLDALVQDNLFVFPLHGEGEWHRYHHLLRMVFQHRAAQTLSAAARAALHARAGRWLEADGQIDAAIGHAVQAGDIQAVADLVRSHRHELINDGRWARLEMWRRLIPRGMIARHPQLLILDAWSFSRGALIPELTLCLDGVEALLPAVPMAADEEQLLCSELDTMRSQVLFWAGDVERSVEAARRSVAVVPSGFSYTRALAWLFATVGLDMAGRGKEASAMLGEALRADNWQSEDSFPTLALISACFLYWQRADMVRLDKAANRMLALAQARNHFESVAWARYWRGCARYQQNDLAGAERDFAAVADMAYIAHPLAYSQSLIGLAAAYQAQGEFDKAYEAAAQGCNRFRESAYVAATARAEGYLAHLAFRQGRMDEALRWVAQPSRVDPATPMPTFHAAAIGRAAILLGLDTADARAEAAELLGDLRVQVERLHNTRFLIEVLALQALSLASSGQVEEALDLLERAVLLTEPGEAIRSLADLDFQVGPLLEELARRGTARPQIARVRRAALVFRPAGPPEYSARAATERAPVTPPRIHHPDLLETLTLREMDVLLLLLDRLSNKEIAQQLNISAETVKRHLTNIYLKFNVDNRRQAIVQARAMGILPK